MQFFSFSSPVDPSRIQYNFEKTLERHNITVTPNALDALFAKLKAMGSVDGVNPESPFPLVRSVMAAHNHAKRMKDALGGKAGPKLGKCQQVLADFYGFGKWDFFKSSLMKFSNVQMETETQATSKVLQSVPVEEFPQLTAPKQSELGGVGVEKNGPSFTEKAAKAAVETKTEREYAIKVAEADRQWAMDQADQIAAQEEADRQWAMDQADQIAAQEEADRQWAMDQADQIAAQEEADLQWAMDEADRIAAEEEADLQSAMDEADRIAAEEANHECADYQDYGEDDFIDGPTDWTSKLDPLMQDFASQFGSEEEFDEYMERF